MAFNLRVVVFAIPPALPAIRSDLGLSYSATGSITSLLLLTLGVGSIPGARLAALARNPHVWQVAALFTFQNVVYYTVATWLPFLLRARGPGYLAVTLLFLNCIPILPLILLSVVRWQYALSSAFYVVSGLLCAVGAVGLLLRLVDVAWLLALMIGLGTAAAFIGSLALPPLLARDERGVAGFSAFLFTSGYVLAFAGPIPAGALVDAT